MATERFLAFLSAPENRLCFDCGKSVSQYISVSFGVTLCEDCANEHKLLHLGVLRKLSESTWTKEELEFLPGGGNKAFETYLSMFNVEKSAPPDFKYCIKAAIVYRNQLQAAAHLEEEGMIDLLPIEEALEVVDFKEEESSTDGLVTQAFSGAAETTNTAIGGLYDTLNEFTKRPTIKKIEDTSVWFLEGLEARVNRLFGVTNSQTQGPETELDPI